MKCIPLTCDPDTANGLEFFISSRHAGERHLLHRILQGVDFVSKLVSYALDVVGGGDMIKCRFIFERIEKSNFSVKHTEVRRTPPSQNATTANQSLRNGVSPAAYRWDAVVLT